MAIALLLLRIGLSLWVGLILRIGLGLGIRIIAALRGIVARALLGRQIGLRGSGLRIAHLQIVFDLDDTRHLPGNRLGQLLRAIACDRARERHLALNGGGRNHVILESLRGIEGVDHIHLNLSVAAPTRSRILRQSQDAAQRHQPGPGNYLPHNSVGESSSHLSQLLHLALNCLLLTP